MLFNFSDYTKYHSRRWDAKRQCFCREMDAKKGKRRRQPKLTTPLTYLSSSRLPGVGAERSKSAHRLKRPSPTVIAVVATIATITPEALVITTKESLTVGLRRSVTVPSVISVVAVVAFAVPVKMRPLRIVILPPLLIIRAGVQPVLIALVHRNL